MTGLRRSVPTRPGRAVMVWREWRVAFCTGWKAGGRSSEVTPRQCLKLPNPLIQLVPPARLELARPHRQQILS